MDKQPALTEYELAVLALMRNGGLNDALATVAAGMQAMTQTLGAVAEWYVYYWDAFGRGESPLSFDDWLTQQQQ